MAAVQQVLSSLPDFILRALEQAGVTDVTIASSLANQSSQAASAIADASRRSLWAF